MQLNFIATKASPKARFITRIVIIFLSGGLPITTFSQFIHGIVYETGTSRPVANASVYYNGSLTGTVTNNSGNFELPLKNRNLPIAISCIGYQSTIVSNYSDTGLVEIFLSPKSQELTGVVIRSDGMSREEKERQFIKDFLGTSEFARSCTIDNLYEVDIIYNYRNKSLAAYSDKPLQITNKKLGYQVYYYLDHFEKTSRNIVYAGNFIFKDVIDPDSSEYILRNRLKAYQGSRMQFIRALYNGELKENGFTIYTPLYHKLSEKDIVRVNDSSDKYIQLNERLLISYQANAKKFSSIMQTGTGAYITGEGFYNASLRWDGPIALQRIGDLLPFEYQPGNMNLQDPTIKAMNSVSKKNSSPGLQSKEKHPGLALSSADLEVVNAIVLSPNNPLDKRLVVKKWQTPVRYKIYGSFGQQNDKKLVEYMHTISELTGLEILPAANDSEVNFYILSGGNPERFTKVITQESITYLKLPGNDGYYYTVSDNGFTTIVLLIGFYKHPSQDEKWEVIKKKLMKGFGLFGTLPDRESSVFYKYNNTTPDSILPSDGMIIKALYDPSVKSGTTKAELNEILKAKN